MNIELNLGEGESISVPVSSILLVHENTKNNWSNVFCQQGELIVRENKALLDFLDTCGFSQAYTRFNPSTEANMAGVKTPWEEGEQYKVWYSPMLPVMTGDGKTRIMIFNHYTRIEQKR